MGSKKLRCLGPTSALDIWKNKIKAGLGEESEHQSDLSDKSLYLRFYCFSLSPSSDCSCRDTTIIIIRQHFREARLRVCRRGCTVFFLLSLSQYEEAQSQYVK